MQRTWSLGFLAVLECSHYLEGQDNPDRGVKDHLERRDALFNVLVGNGVRYGKSNPSIRPPLKELPPLNTESAKRKIVG